MHSFLTEVLQDVNVFQMTFNLIQNLALIYTFISLFLQKFTVNYLGQNTAKDKNHLRGIIFFAFIEIITMADPISFHNMPSMHIDLRTSIIILSTAYLGPYNGLAVSIITIALRFVMGGYGWIPWAPAAFFIPSLAWISLKLLKNRYLGLTIANIFCVLLSLLPLGAVMLTPLGRHFISFSPFSYPENFFQLYITLTLCNILACMAFDLALKNFLQNQHKYEDLKAKVNIDHMTGLQNHRSFQQQLSRLLRKECQDKASLSLLMIDVDYFKNYNDTLGHQCGDELLRQIGGVFTSSLRNQDIVARYGGEEFSIILPGTDKKTAAHIAEHVRKEVEGFPFHGIQQMPMGKMTISAGIAHYPTDADDKQALISAADKALYHAKSQGRNRVCVFEKNFSDRLINANNEIVSH